MENSIEDPCFLENNQLGKTYMKKIFPVKSLKDGREQVEYLSIVRDVFAKLKRIREKKKK